MTPPITLSVADAHRCLAAPRWWEPASLRRLLSDSPSTLIGHDAGPDPQAPEWAFLAADSSPLRQPALRTVRRFLVVLRGQAVLCLDVAVGQGPLEWRLVPSPEANLLHKAVLAGTGDAADEHLYLNVLSTAGLAIQPIHCVDLAGARVGQRVVVFHAAPGMNRSAVFFDLEAPGKLDYLVAGLAPGGWDLWKDGYLDQADLLVRPQAGTLTWSGEAGNFFLRHR